MEKLLTTIKKWMIFVLSRIATVLLSVMTLLVLYQVFTRYVLNDPAAFTEELVKYSLIWTGFIGAAYAFYTREHMALIVFRDKLDPQGRKILMIFIGPDPSFCPFCHYHRRGKAGFKCPERIFRTSRYPQKPCLCHGSDFRCLYHCSSDH